MKSAVSRLTAISIIAILIIVAVLGAYFATEAISTQRTTTTSSTVSRSSNTSTSSSVVIQTERQNCSVVNSNGQWLTYKYDSERTGFSAENFSQANGFLGQLVWRNQSIGLTAQLVSVENVIFAANYYTNALGVSNGKSLWSVATGVGPFPPLSSDGKIVYLGSNGGGLVSIAPTTGQNELISEEVMASGATAICGNVAYVTSSPGMFYPPTPTGSIVALNLTSDDVIWQVNLTSQSFTGYPSTDGRLVYTTLSNNTVEAFSTATGALVWSESFSQPLTQSPPTSSGELFVTTSDGDVFALNSSDGKEIWSVNLGASIEDLRSSTSIGYGMLFLGTSDGLFSLNSENGSIIWQAKLGNPTTGTPTVVDGSVFIADDNGTLYDFNAHTGVLLWHFSGLGMGFVSEPIMTDGMIIIDGNNGLFAFR